MNNSQNIWNELKRPFFVLAPMEDVTDTVFRQMVMNIGRPDLFFTEFTSVEGLCSKGSDVVMQRLKYLPTEKPLIAQLWGINPMSFEKASTIVHELGFDGIDINMGCPVRKIIRNGGCSALIKTPTLAKEIYEATVSGAKGLPVSVKTRIGFKSIQTEEWIGEVLSWKPAALTVHGRTVAELSKVPCHWDEIGKAVQLRDSISPNTIIVGNGDVNSIGQGLEYHRTYGVDGIMIGRGIFENPWVFNPVECNLDHSLDIRLKLVYRHVMLHRKTWGDTHNFNPLKKFFKMYIKGFDGAAQLRDQMMRLNSVDEILEFILKFRGL